VAFIFSIAFKNSVPNVVSVAIGCTSGST
jgi:hypothetical protein